MENKIQIIEKPEWVSWNEIHEVLVNAHAENRGKGIIMKLPTLSGEEISKMVTDKEGKMFVAIEGEHVVGTLALLKKNSNQWYVSGDYGYLCLGAVLPNYSGKGIYRSLYQLAETTAKQLGYTVLTRDTNEKNARMLKISKKEGYYFVSMRVCKDHFNIVRAKWLNKCPYSPLYIKLRFALSKAIVKTRFKLDPEKGLVKRI